MRHLMITCPSTFFLLLSLFIVFHAASARDDESLISNTCRNTSRGDPNIRYGFCVTSLKAAPGGECASLRGLGRISIRLVGDNVTATRCHIKRLLRANYKWDTYTRQCLKDCFELYSDAIPSLEEAMKSYRSGHYDDANVQVSAVMEGFSTCEDGFTDRKGGASSPLTKQNSDAFELSAISLAVMDMLS